MSFHRARVDTIRAIIAGSPSLSAHHSFAAISNELEEVKSLMHVGLVRRRYLLAVLHATRALDVALKTFVAVLGLHHSPSTSLGKSLRYIELSAPTVLGSAFAMRQRFPGFYRRVAEPVHARSRGVSCERLRDKDASGGNGTLPGRRPRFRVTKPRRPFST